MKFFRWIYYAVFLVLSSSPAFADWVRISTGPANSGIGFVFQDQSGCRVIVPKHVYQVSDQVRLTTIHGDTSVLRLERAAESEDIALFRFHRNEPACSSQWDHVRSNAYEGLIIDALDRKLSASLRTIVNGSFEYQRVLVRRYNADHIEFEVSDDFAASYNRQGLSGSGLYIDFESGRSLVGIITDWNEERNVFVALRTEAIPQVLGLRFPSDINETSTALDNATDEEQLLDESDVVPSGSRSLPVFPPNETACDFLAANPSDPNKHPHSIGVPWGSISLEDALFACQQAVDEFGLRSPRLIYQLGRVQEAALAQKIAAGEEVGALDLFEVMSTLTDALNAGHIHAIVNLETLLLDRPEVCVDRNRCFETFLNRLDQLGRIEPVYASYQRALTVAFNDVPPGHCAEYESCDAMAAELLEQTKDTDFEAQGMANLAFLVFNNRASKSCPDDPGCSGFLRDSFRNGAASGLVWARRELGELLIDRRGEASLCSDEETCYLEGLSHLEAAADGNDVRALRELGHFFSYNETRDLVDCQSTYGMNCTAHGFGFYERAVEAGSLEAQRDVAWANLYRQREIGCDEDPQPCAVRAFEILSDGRHNTDWSASLRAYGMDRFPEIFEAMCGDTGCAQASLNEHLKAASTRTYNMHQAALAIYYANDELDCGASTSDAGGCIGLALEMFEAAYRGGRESSFEDWNHLMRDLAGANWSAPVNVSSPIEQQSETAPVVIVEEGAVDTFLREKDCYASPKNCTPYLLAWLSAVEAQIEKEGYGALDSAFLPLAAFAMSGQHLQDVEDVAQRLLIKFFEVLDRQYDRFEDLDPYYFPVDGLEYLFVEGGCNSGDCRDFVAIALREIPPRFKQWFIAGLSIERLLADCNEASYRCKPLSEAELIAELMHISVAPFLDERSFNRVNQGTFADFLVRKAIAEGSWNLAAYQAKRRIWDDDGNFLAADYSEEDYREILEVIGNRIIEAPDSWYTNHVADAAIVALNNGGFDQVHPITIGNFYLSIHELQTLSRGDSSFDFWRSRSASIMERTTFAMQQALGFAAAEIDGDWGPRTNRAIEEYLESCNGDRECSWSRIRLAVRNLLASI